MSDFKLSRFRYTWKGQWQGDSSTYNRDDIVFYEGKSWVCIRQHTSSLFQNDLTYIPPGESLVSPAWVKMTDGYTFKGDWTSSTLYEPGILVLHGGHIYLSLVSHTSSTYFNSDLIKWEVFALGSDFKNEWTPSTRYLIGDVVRYNGFTYQCIFEHVSGTITDTINAGNNDFVDDSTKETWVTLVENYTSAINYQPSTRYRKNDLVKYGGSILKCITEHVTTSTIGAIDNSKFVTYLPGFEYDSEWNSNTYYAIGDVVSYGGTIYTASENNLNSQPGVSEVFQNGNPTWTIVTGGLNFEGEFDPQGNIFYKQGDVVRRGGSLWVSLTNQTNDNSTLSPLDTSNWELLISAQNFRGSWRVDTDYNFYDVVYYKGIVYYANVPHFSAFETLPGDNGEGNTYWTIITIGDDSAALTILGDLLTYNLNRNVIEDGSTSFTIGDQSTFGPTNVPIGENDQVLVVEDNLGSLGYKHWGTLHRVFFVRTNGIDDDTDPNRGSNYFKPWRTLRFALEHADDGYEGFTTIKVSTGEYEEILPLIVPARTAIVGEELRSTTIRASGPITALANDATYTIGTLLRLSIIMPSVIQGILVPKSTGNNFIQNTSITGTNVAATLIDGLFSNMIGTIDYLVNDNGSMPVVTGSNTQATDLYILNAILTLQNNRNFLKAEAIAYAQQEYPTYEFNVDKCSRDIDKFLDAIEYDLRYPGNYKSVLAARYYANAVRGSELEDMFYVRDTTGIRNLTLKGLEGTLPAPQVGENYQIPTGGAFVSLDPGWGPNDERVWVTNRSCYVQNVTTFGTGAIGQKIDGLLHNGGNKSIVSNDFTQVISDGIGAWVQNGGRAELVSVFTYYAHIGMFAKDGGIIRATNGNSSYGDFGSVADGIDPDEVVRYGYVNARTEQAQVKSAFAGEILDFILALEFSNAGQNYTTASYSFVSSGVGAVALQEEFRDNAMFECQVVESGSGFNQYGNQAQSGNELTITLSSRETIVESDILGMRIIIISGEGTGQYGYVQAYNPGTKLCTVYRESDDQPGWDHLIPGTRSASLLTTGTRYRIEPRITFVEPAYSATAVTINTANAWAAATYGETDGQFLGIAGQLGTGTTLEATPTAATFDVIKTGRSYSVSVVNTGVGYKVGDIITIDGALVGGISVEHDITIVVTEVTDDSTNSIVAIEVSSQSIGDSGKFILTPSSGHFGRYSSDGDTWTSFDLPSDGNWKCLATGDYKFVAISGFDAPSTAGAVSTNGIDWTATTLPASRLWSGVVYGKPSTTSTGIFVAVSSNLNSAAYSTDGETWTSSTLPTAGDSTISQWVDITFGRNIFVAIANSNNIAAVGTWNGSTLTWQATIMDAVSDSSQKDWVSVAYGNRRFVAISSTGDVAYSFDGLEWYGATMPTQDGSTAHNWKQIKYGQGVFFAVGDTGSKIVGNDLTTGPTTFAATSYDGIVWTERILSGEENWGVVTFGNPDVTLNDSTFTNSKPTWIVAPTTSSNQLSKVYTGARALGRILLDGSGISLIKIWEPGSGYQSYPTATIVDPKKSVDPELRTRLADGVLAQPVFISKGSAYKTSTTTVTVTGDGFADITPVGRYITLDGLTLMPGPGAQFYIAGKTSFYTAVIVDINSQLQANGTIRSTFQISPRPDLGDFIEHGMEVLIRERYSQVRITGHDFLDVGTGNFIETNYPLLYKDYEFTTAPTQEVQNLNGGRVFYTSTDQDGNFRAGELFAVEQATGVVTISADFFDLEGLTEIRLAGVQVGSTAVVREFSKDALFLQNSNNVIPTQRAIKGYLESRLNIGGEDLLVPSITAGLVRLGPNLINSTADLTIDVDVVVDFTGSAAGISGSIVAQTMFFRSFNFKG